MISLSLVRYSTIGKFHMKDLAIIEASKPLLLIGISSGEVFQEPPPYILNLDFMLH